MSSLLAKNFKKRKTKKRSWLGYLRIFVFRLFLLFVIASFLQVLLLKWLPPLYSATMFFDKVGSFFEPDAKMDLQYRWRSIDKISSHMPLAVIAAEDQNFPNHFGFDLKAIEKAIESNKKGKGIRGASTLTQQVAKNLFLWPNRDYLRKAMEAYYTLLIELLWSKQRIVEMYVNIAEMGYGVYGVEAAAQNFYKKEAANLNRNEAALLAAVLPSPKKFSAKNPSVYVQGRRSWIVKQMYQLGDVKFLETLN